MTRLVSYPLAALVSAALWAGLIGTAWGVEVTWNCLDDDGEYRPCATLGPCATPTPTLPPHECGKGPVTVRVEHEAPCADRVGGDAYRIRRESWPRVGTLGRIEPCTRTVLRPEQWTDWPECGGEPVRTPDGACCTTGIPPVCSPCGGK